MAFNVIKCKIENVQRKFVGLNGTYKDKLGQSGFVKLLSLEDRRVQFDLEQVFKIVNKFDDVSGKMAQTNE